MSPLSRGARRSDTRRLALTLGRAALAAGLGSALLLPRSVAAQTPPVPTPTAPTPDTSSAPTPAPTPAPVVQVAAPVQAPTRDYVRQFVITPRGGYIAFDRATSLEAGAAIGVDAHYTFTPSFSLGTNFTFARANTRGEDFLTALTYGLVATGDTTFIFGVRQPVSVVDAQVAAVLRIPSYGRISPFLTGGGGIYVLYLDPEANIGSTRIVKPAAMGGAGVDVRLSNTAGIRLDVRDMVFFKYDRERLRPSDERFRNPRILEGLALPPTPKKTINNFMFSLGFTFTPQATDERTGPTPREEDQ